MHPQERFEVLLVLKPNGFSWMLIYHLLTNQSPPSADQSEPSICRTRALHFDLSLPLTLSYCNADAVLASKRGGGEYSVSVTYFLTCVKPGLWAVMMLWDMCGNKWPDRAAEFDWLKKWGF